MVDGKYLLIIFMFFLGSILYSCSSKKHSDFNVEFICYDFSGENVDTKTISYSLKIHQTDPYTIFEYLNERKKEDFYVNFTDLCGHIIQSNDTIKMFFLDKLRFIENMTDTIDIIKFVSLPHNIDGAHYYYLSFQHGVVLRESTTWPNFSKLLVHYIDDHAIDNIISTILYNEYFNAKLKIPMEEPPPPPIEGM